MPVFIKDTRSRASTLTHVEHSALHYFHMLLWENDGSIPDDDKITAKALRLTTKQWQAMKPTILADCTIAQGRICREATVKELEKARKQIAQKSAAGRASAAARNANGRSTADATDVQPRAGGGGGKGYSPSVLSQEEGFVERDACARDALRVVDGGLR